MNSLENVKNQDQFTFQSYGSWGWGGWALIAFPPGVGSFPYQLNQIVITECSLIFWLARLPMCLFYEYVLSIRCVLSVWRGG